VCLCVIKKPQHRGGQGSNRGCSAIEKHETPTFLILVLITPVELGSSKQYVTWRHNDPCPHKNNHILIINLYVVLTQNCLFNQIHFNGSFLSVCSVLAQNIRRRSSAAWLLGSRVRIPLRAWAFVCAYMLCCRM
jgi:hypothetical protein